MTGKGGPPPSEEVCITESTSAQKVRSPATYKSLCDLGHLAPGTLRICTPSEE